MFTRVRHSLNTTMSLMLGVVVALVSMMVVAGSASAGVAGGRTFATGPLVAPFSGPSGFASPFSLVRDGAGSFGSFSGESPQALTVDQATGDIYAMEASTGKLWRFDSTGAAKNFTAGPGAGTNTITGLNFGEFAGLDQIAVDSSSGPAKGDIYVTESGLGRISVFASTGALLGTLKGSANPNGKLGEDCGVAVDQSNGDVYIASRGFEIWRYTPTSSFVAETDYSGGIEVSIEPCQLAVANGNLYAKQWQEFPILGAGPLEKYETSAFTIPEIGFGTPTQVAQNVTAVATDPTTGDVYADLGNKISVFNTAGNALYTFGSSSDFGSESSGVAMNSSTGNAYVADPSHKRVDVYGPVHVAPPIATTGQATQIHHVKATLTGHLDLNGGPEITDCHFDWGTTNSYGNTTPCTQGNNYAAPADVTATTTGLEPGKTYHYRLSVTNTAGTATGADQTFETVPVPVVHVITSTFGASGSGDGQLSGNAALAVNQTTGNVYVADTSNHRIDEFDPSGTFISASGWGVKDGKNEAETCASGCQAGISGSGAGQLATPTFVAVDNSGGPSAGDVYVGDTTNNTVTKYDSTGNYISTNDGSASGTAFGPLAGVAVNANGDLWVYDTQADMRKFAQNGTFITKWNSGFGVTPAGIAVDSTDHPYIVRGTPVVEKLTPTGSDLGEISGAEFTGPTTGFAIDPATGDLYIDDGGKKIRLYRGTCNPSAGKCPNVESFGASDLVAASGVTVKSTSGRVYVSDPDKVKIFDPATPPDVTTGTASAPSATTATLGGTVGPNGVALIDCHFEYVTDAAFLATGFTDLSSGGTAPCTPSAGSITADLEDHAVTATITGLDQTTLYHFRLVVANAQTTVNGQPALIPGAALVETTGSPTRTTTTARLDSRVDPRGAATSYHFEYGDQGPCDSNPCTATPVQSAGSGETFELVSQQLTDLKANITYHYRIVADNGVPGGIAYGNDATVTTRASDAPLTHGHFPGPPGSDRAWEQVNAPDLGGNSVLNSLATSSNGERVIYGIEGGNPGSQNGGGLFGASNYHLAERTASGWKTNFVYPARAQATGNEWTPPAASEDLSHIYDINRDGSLVGDADVWSLSPGQPAQKLSGVPIGEATETLVSSAAGSRVITVRSGGVWDVTSSPAHLISVMPGGSVSCGSTISESYVLSSEGWVSPDGSRAFFYARCGDEGLYVRNFAESTTTEVVPGGPNHEPNFLHATMTEVFFTTNLSLDPNDTGGTDVYSYDLGNGEYDCLTCFPGHVGNLVGHNNDYISVSDDGSRVYFAASARLLPGAATEGIYRVDVAHHELAYVAPGGGGFRGRDTAGIRSAQGKAISPDGSVFVFRSDNPALNALGGQKNGGTAQYYRYDDRDRSLVCASCPGDGSVPVATVSEGLGGDQPGPNQTPLDAAGDLVFTTATPLVAADQNTARSGQDPTRGDDLYEWRDGRLLLVTDGTSDDTRPEFNGFSRDGRDLIFAQYAQLTPDALDGNRRIYDARIGGGFEFPNPPPPCPLDACQGNPVPAPFDSTPASANFSGPGNLSQHSVTTTTTRTKTTKQVKCKNAKKRKTGSKCRAPAKCKKGKKGGKCRKARHANTIRRAGR